MEERTPCPETLIPTSVSYRQLATLLSSALSELEAEGTAPEPTSADRQAFDALLVDWWRSSHRLLAAMGRGGAAVSEGRNPRQLMALGALQAHLALALQAHSGATGNQPD
jgi:hypothetical protein